MAKNKFYSDYDRSTVITILICMTVIAVGCVLGIASFSIRLLQQRR